MPPNEGYNYWVHLSTGYCLACWVIQTDRAATVLQADEVPTDAILALPKSRPGFRSLNFSVLAQTMSE
jgi:hypothetical protein